MAKSVKDLPDETKDLIDIREWDMRTMEGNQRFLELKAKSLPSIALDGELVYEALIPGQEELTAEIRHRWQLKREA
ncbi:MAG: hypothetical protein JRD64_07345 [Deltaproteobacteria bacterium]|jgi:hypothetical protein|nr:hypothetical protein [Deltaproteobacteria bacterium]